MILISFYLVFSGRSRIEPERLTKDQDLSRCVIEKESGHRGKGEAIRGQGYERQSQGYNRGLIGFRGWWTSLLGKSRY